jgi:hypothetical protein
MFKLPEKHNFKYFKNPTVKVGIIWCNYVYMYILYCNIYWWKLIDISEASNKYAHLFLVEREYFGFNTLESVIVE